ncbi:hypothetical protein L596_019529 [Steinernema carpocapsae]|uniref:COP9 signalosome complex subunit 6 n=1 Tax=Steinernema carpocapsae TaxID=34508 RepID=A0A4U5MQW7_STECR|nr:hypothetical protein L596_019529 [Steinernema carpocapsae]
MSSADSMMETENGNAPAASTLLRVPVSDVLVHPLVMMNMSEHAIRSRLQNDGQEPPRVFGVLLGRQNGTTAEIVNSFELKPVTGEDLLGETPIDENFMRTRTAQFIEVFSTLHVLGWYCCDASTYDADEYDVKISRQMREFHESPLLVKLNTNITPEMNKVPMLIYHLFNEAKDDLSADGSVAWSQMKWSLKCDDAEQIGVEHIARISANATSDQVSSKGKHLKAQINAVEMLMMRMKLIVQYLKSASEGVLPKNPEILSEMKKLCERIRLLIDAERDDRGKQQIVDYKTAAVLCNMTELAGLLGELIQKTNIISSERGTSIRGGGPNLFGFGGKSGFGSRNPFV